MYACMYIHLEGQKKKELLYKIENQYEVSSVLIVIEQPVVCDKTKLTNNHQIM